MHYSACYNGENENIDTSQRRCCMQHKGSWGSGLSPMTLYIPHYRVRLDQQQAHSLMIPAWMVIFKLDVPESQNKDWNQSLLAHLGIQDSVLTAMTSF